MTSPQSLGPVRRYAFESDRRAADEPLKVREFLTSDSFWASANEVLVTARSAFRRRPRFACWRAWRSSRICLAGGWEFMHAFSSRNGPRILARQQVLCILHAGRADRSGPERWLDADGSTLRSRWRRCSSNFEDYWRPFTLGAGPPTGLSHQPCLRSAAALDAQLARRLIGPRQWLNSLQGTRALRALATSD